MKVALLTSSRADFGIYYPLARALDQDPSFELDIIAFGTHLSLRHGETVNSILESGFMVSHKIDTMPSEDTPAAISEAIGKTIINFTTLWKQTTFDLIIAMGDRFEMFGACASAVPFGIPIAHIHGGETTKGAIDDTFRHAITQMSSYHFTTTGIYRDRVVELKGEDTNVYNVGALSIDNLKNLDLLSKEDFKERFSIDLDIPSILITFHPETVAFQKNKEYIVEFIKALKEITEYQLIITMPNVDTMGNLIREELKKFISENRQAIGVESFGTIGYLSCLKYCKMMLGNSSSGFVEASYFNRFVINVGDRQKGRIITDNIFNCDINCEIIVAAVKSYKNYAVKSKPSIYGDGNTAEKIVEILKHTNA